MIRSNSQDLLKGLPEDLKIKPGTEIVSRTPDILKDAVLLKEKYQDGLLISGTDYLLEEALKNSYELITDYMRDLGFKSYREINYSFGPELWLVKPKNANEVYTRFINIAERECPDLKPVYREGQEEKYLTEPFNQAMLCVVVSGESIADKLDWSKPKDKDELREWLEDEEFKVKKVLESMIEIYYWGPFDEEPIVNRLIKKLLFCDTDELEEWVKEDFNYSIIKGYRVDAKWRAEILARYLNWRTGFEGKYEARPAKANKYKVIKKWSDKNRAKKIKGGDEL